MSFVRTIFYFFSGYTDPAERRAGRFFSKLSEKSRQDKMLKSLLQLMQSNIVVINLWSESKYKGYHYLTKRTRKRLYSNVTAIRLDFEKHLSQSPDHTAHLVLDRLKRLGFDIHMLSNSVDKLAYLSDIMEYFSPLNGRYKYRESSTFGELLKDPAVEQLVGDCNQIVTLYIYFYSLRYDIADLRLVSYPGHVALHFMGVDIETTTGQFKKFNKKDRQILPVQEIVSINLLDTTDAYFKTHKVPPEAFLQSARVAYLVSSNRSIVNKNLQTAYRNIVGSLLRDSNYSAALKYAKQSNDSDLLHTVGHNGAIYFSSKNQFSSALAYARYANDKKDLENHIHQNQGAYLYKIGAYNKAINAFKLAGNHDFVNHCYAGLYMEEQKKLGNISTSEELKRNRTTIHNMQSYARKSENAKLIEHANSLANYL